MTKNIINSYSAAGIYPVKLLKYKVVDSKGRILPIHVQLNLTNKCNLSCNYCSCENRDRRLKMDYDEIREVMWEYRRAGCQAVTITGGGEPLLHPNVNDILKDINNMGIRIGLVTNGVAIKRIKNYHWMTWIRVSFDDHRKFDTEFEKNLSFAVNGANEVDWAFSYVVAPEPDYKNLQKVIKFANRCNFTHIRLVSNLLDLASAPTMSWIKIYLKNLGVDDSRVIYQARKSYTQGAKRCLISLLKPVVDVDGILYPCCGAQYATAEPSRKFEESLAMGTVKDIDKIFKKQKHYDGSKCVRCYYESYNEALENITRKLDHVEFV